MLVRIRGPLGVYLVPLVGVLAGACASGAQPAVRPGSTAPSGPAASDSAGVHDAAVRFLAAFDSLQWAPFSAALAPDVTVFMPGSADPPRRLDGRAAVETEFRRFFDGVRASRTQAGRPAPPFLGLAGRVRDVHVQRVAAGAAVVSFHLAASGAPGSAEVPPARRSLVFRREGDGVWRVIHWHASSPPRPSGP
jgi:hypothetical protein